MNVLAIKRGDEGLVELAHDRVGHFVAQMLDAADFFDLGIDVAVVGEQVDKRAGGVDQIVRHRGEHVEKTCVPGNDSEHWVAANSNVVECNLRRRLRSEPTISRAAKSSQIRAEAARCAIWGISRRPHLTEPVWV